MAACELSLALLYHLLTPRRGHHRHNVRPAGSLAKRDASGSDRSFVMTFGNSSSWTCSAGTGRAQSVRGIRWALDGGAGTGDGPERGRPLLFPGWWHRLTGAEIPGEQARDQPARRPLVYLYSRSREAAGAPPSIFEADGIESAGLPSCSGWLSRPHGWATPSLDGAAHQRVSQSADRTHDAIFWLEARESHKAGSAWLLRSFALGERPV